MAALNNDRLLVRAILDQYLFDTAANLDQIDEAISCGELTTITRIAHSIKGASLNIGAQEVAQQADSAGNLNESADMSAFRSIQKKMRDAYAEVAEAIGCWNG